MKTQFFFSMLLSSLFFDTSNCLASLQLDTPRDFIFIRHGQTPLGPADILKGPQDLTLNETGLLQANAAGSTLKENQLITDPIIYSSTLLRAYQTASIVANKLSINVPIKTEPGLQERYYGDYSKASSNNISEYKPVDAETTESFEARVRQALILIFRQASTDARELILVSHQKVFEFLAQWLAQQKLKLDQGGVCLFKFNNGKYHATIYDSSSSSEDD